MFLKIIPILDNNYVWIIYDAHRFCTIIDPGLSDPIIKVIEEEKLIPITILLTHNHIDHVEGVRKIVKKYPKIIVFGPLETKKHGVNNIITGGDKIPFLNKKFYVFSTPGHTEGHVSYYMKPYIFCGDTLFSGGCGRVYNKKYLEMFNSIKLISLLPEDTILCCSHEYTLSNLMFSMFILPNDKKIKLYFKKIKNLIKLKKTSLPSYIFYEKDINLFLRTKENILRNAIGLHESSSSLEVFIKLRLIKDVF